MHDVAISNLGELAGRLIEYGKEQGEFSLTIALDANGDYSTAFIFGREDLESPMAAGASYGYGRTWDEALREVARECRLIGERKPDPVA